ncbi:MAG: UDP-N-acetylglucosamine--N-acetylmuramyl-(pentapeptide) pyrophosphoryl-undecaprenol N-acetylglucosamine transferase, partial [Chloroflexota bacterium]
AWRYQKVNADYLVEQGAAVLLRDEAMKDELLSTLHNLMTDPARLTAMRAAGSTLAMPNGAANTARELLRLAGDNL